LNPPRLTCRVLSGVRNSVERMVAVGIVTGDVPVDDGGMRAGIGRNIGSENGRMACHSFSGVEMRILFFVRHCVSESQSPGIFYRFGIFLLCDGLKGL